MLKAVIDRFEGDYAVLVFSDGQRFNWPRNKLPSGVAEGSIVWITAVNDKMVGENQKELAKEILNEILNPQR